RADLAYPPLRQCFDFNEALWVKTWLTYRLGRVLLECDRDKLKGGYFKFFSKIKQAKKEFKALKESKVYRLKDELKFKNEEDFDLFIKNYALIENLLTHYEALNEVIVSNMAFVLEHFDEVSLWLNSKEFKEKYEDINHPYPPLLNPDKLNDENYILNYEKIPANLAWEMNLPLPRGYKFIYLNNGASASSAILNYFSLSGVKIYEYWVPQEENYHLYYNDLLGKNNFVAVAVHIHYSKLPHLLIEKVPALYVTRDPISKLKSISNHFICGLNALDYIKSTMKRFNLTCKEYSKLIPKNKYWKHNGEYPRCDVTFEDNWLLYGCLSFDSLIQKMPSITDIYFFDFNEFEPKNVFLTWNKLAKLFHFSIPDRLLLETRREVVRFGLSVLPACLYALEEDVTKNKEDRSGLNKEGGYEIYISADVIQKFREDIIIIDETNINDSKIIAYVKDECKDILHNEKLLQESKKFLEGYFQALRENVDKTKENLITERKVLEYLKKDIHTRNKIKKLLDEELNYLKIHRPDIVASWKYYKEFEKMCEELKTKVSV
ncbi:DUF2972 domain-containing protein, partial [Campylobacter upsaliensis]|nr:DUF2972 domain-containing protein [Campylobacter upsaliensis]EAV9673793.1 DUF2972 domain-containing protein [Campylobacter upsaliensis]